MAQKKETVTRNRKCPHCGVIVKVKFDDGDQDIGGKPVVCEKCNACFYCYLNNEEIIFHSSARDQYGKPRILKTADAAAP